MFYTIIRGTIHTFCIIVSGSLVSHYHDYYFLSTIIINILVSTGICYLFPSPLLIRYYSILSFSSVFSPCPISFLIYFVSTFPAFTQRLFVYTLLFYMQDIMEQAGAGLSWAKLSSDGDLSILNLSNIQTGKRASTTSQ